MSRRRTLVPWLIGGVLILSMGLVLAALRRGVFGGAAQVGDIEHQRAFVQQDGFLTTSDSPALADYAEAIALLKGPNFTRETLKKLRQGETPISPPMREILLKAAELVTRGATAKQCDWPKASVSERVILGDILDTPLKVGSQEVPKEGFGLCVYACAIVGDMRRADGRDAEAVHVYKAALAMGLQLGTSDDDVLRAYGIAAKQTALESILNGVKASPNGASASQVAAMIAHVRKEFEQLKKEAG